VHNLVQQNGEVKDRESLDERERHPQQRPENQELPDGYQQMARGAFFVQLPQHGPRDGLAELGPQRGRMLPVIMVFHRTYSRLYSGFPCGSVDLMLHN
jgi:hypothetical protein